MLEFFAAFAGHLNVHPRAAGGVPVFVVLQTGDGGVFAAQHLGAGRRVLGDVIERIRFEIDRTRAQVELGALHQRFEIGLVERLDPGREGRVAEDENRGAVFAGNPPRLNRGVETIFHRGRSQHHAGAVAVSAEDGLVQIALLDVGREAGAWAAALHVHNNERHFGHGGPADRLGFQ